MNLKSLNTAEKIATLLSLRVLTRDVYFYNSLDHGDFIRLGMGREVEQTGEYVKPTYQRAREKAEENLMEALFRQPVTARIGSLAHR